VPSVTPGRQGDANIQCIGRRKETFRTNRPGGPANKERKIIMSTIRSTVSAALAVAVISASALFATTGSSMAGGYGYGYGYGNGYGNGYGHGYQLVYQPRCHWTKVKVWTHYGWQWQKIKVCN
jgi:hypothetical protein